MASSKRPRTSSQSPSRVGSPHPQDAVRVAYISPPVSQEQVITCSLPHAHTENMSFPSYSAYEDHYASMHTNRCLSAECNRNFPSAHFLTLHIAENHDPIAEARKARGEKIYSCFVEDCDKLCRDWKKRRSHLVDKHGFPRDYDYLIVNSGIDGRRSLLRTPTKGRQSKQDIPARCAFTPRGRGTSGPNSTIHTEEPEDSSGSDREIRTAGTSGHESEGEDDLMASCRSSISSSKQTAPKRRTRPEITDHNSSPTSANQREEIDALTKSMSALKFVPPSVRFGRGGVKRGLARR